MKKIIYLLFLLLSFQITQAQNQKVNKPENKTALLKIGLIADVQYCDCPPAGERYYKQSIKKLSECVNEFNRNNLDFVVNLGDLIDRDFNSYNEVLNILGQLKSPLFHVLGNHDFSIKRKYQSKINHSLNLKNRYYSLKIDNYKFIFLDGNDISLYSRGKLNFKTIKAGRIYKRLEKQGELNATDWNGGIGKKQSSWLYNNLESAKEKGEKVIIFCHFPVNPDNTHYNLWNHEQIKSILNNYDNIISYISGHNHKGNYQLNENIHYLTLKGMVETENENAFSIIEIYADHLNLIGYGREEQRTFILGEK